MGGEPFRRFIGVYISFDFAACKHRNMSDGVRAHRCRTSDCWGALPTLQTKSGRDDHGKRKQK